MHAKEAPDRVRELEQWGGVFDRTPDGKIRSARSAGTRTSASCHIGDRTGLELIRTLQDKRRPPGHRRVHGVHDHAAAQGRRARLRARSATGARPASSSSSGRGRRARHRRLGKLLRITSNSWECTGDGQALAYEAGAELMDMEFVQFHPTGMVWPPGVARAARHRGRARRGRHPAQRGRRALHGALRPGRLELSTRDVVARAIYTEVRRAAARRTAASSSTSLTCGADDRAQASCRACTTSSWSWPASTSRARRWRSGPPVTTSWAASALSRDRRRARSRAVRGRRVLGRAERREPAGWQLALRPARVRQAHRRERGAYARGQRHRGSTSRSSPTPPPR